MVIFILIFFAVLITVGVSMVGGFSFFLKRRANQLRADNQKQFVDQPPYRPLFAPDDEEIRALEQAQTAEQKAKTAEAARLLALKKINAVTDFKEIWTNEPNKLNTVGLFRLAAQSENAETFSETAESVIEFWRENKIANLAAHDLADLLDSHLATLPQQERTAGALFWLRREIMSLRAAASE